MSRFVDDTQRRMVPRWRDSTEAASLNETGALTNQFKNRETVDSDISLNSIQNAWEKNKGIAYANEFVAASLIHRKPEIAKDAAQFVLRNSNKTTKQAVMLANKILGVPNTTHQEVQSLSIHEKSATNIAKLRRSLRTTPNDPIGWTDLSRHFIVLGQHEKAKRAMKMATALASEHRFTIRAATRLYHVLGDSERSLHLLRSRELTNSDPWLIAAEIAMSRIAERTPKLVRKGRELLDSKNIAPFHLSELAASLASLDFEFGNDRQAKKKFQLSMQQPTENAVAQVAWAERHRLHIELPSEYLSSPNTHEALAWTSYEQRDWQDALNQASDWVLDEPFSSRSVIFGGHVASVHLNQNNTAISLYKIGLKSSPHDVSLLNNIAFSHASANEPIIANDYLRLANSLSSEPIQKIYFVATEGLINYRSGKIDEGRANYLDALNRARELGKMQLAFNALCFFAREEVRVNGSLANELLKQLENLAPKHKDISIEPLLSQLLPTIYGSKSQKPLSTSSTNE